MDEPVESVRQRVTAWSTSPPIEYAEYDEAFLEIGCGALRLIGPDFDDAGFIELLLRKHHAYGPKPIACWGPVGVIIRIHSKIERYRHLSKNMSLLDACVGDESIADTLRDIVGYAILGHLLVTEVHG